MRNKVKVLIKALEFYANPRTYQNGGFEGHRDDIYYDQGQVAKTALEKFRSPLTKRGKRKGKVCR